MQLVESQTIIAKNIERNALNSCFRDIIRGVYAVGFAKEQEKYDEAVEKLFSSIDKVSYFFHLIPLDSEAYSVPSSTSKMERFLNTLLRLYFGNSSSYVAHETGSGTTRHFSKHIRCV